MGHELGTEPAGSRTDARSIIAELWAEREDALSSPSAPASPAPPSRRAGKERPPAEPRPKAGSRERALAAVIVLLLVGAGLGIGAKAAGLLGAPSKATFLAKADAICAPGNAALTTMGKSTGYPSVATAASKLVTTADAQLGQLRALELPGGADRGRARGVLDAISATGDAGRSMQTGAAAGDPAMTSVASRSMTLYSQDAVTKAKAFGFTACATGLQPGVDAVVAGANGAVKSSLIDKGNALCAELYRAGEALPKIRNAGDLSRFTAQSVALFEKLASDLKALPVPPGDEATVGELTTQVSTFAGKLRELGTAALAGDVKRVNAIDKESQALLQGLGQQFGAYGLTVCGSTV